MIHFFSVFFDFGSGLRSLKSVIFLFTMIFILSPKIHAHEGHRHPADGSKPVQDDKRFPKQVCDKEIQDLCLHIHFLKTPNSLEESEFTAHIELPNDEDVIEFLNIDLWMDMGNGKGHGSAPVDFKQTTSNKAKVTNAWFVMMGVWDIRVDYKYKNQNKRLIIPVYIKE